MSSMTETTEKSKILNVDDKIKRMIFNTAFVIGWLAMMPVGAFPNLMPVFAITIILCIGICFFDDNFYLFIALFAFMRYKILIGDTPVFRIYSYLAVIKLLTQLPKLKFRVAYIPAILVFVLHCIFAFGRIEGQMRLALNTIVDVALVYLVIIKVLSDINLTRKFLFAFVMGGLISGVYGWTNKDMTVEINVLGGGNETVSRNFGSLGDPNFAGMFYNTCIFISLILKNIPKWLKAVLIAVFVVMLLQTASLSGILTLGVMGCIYIILKYRSKSFFILLFLFIAVSIALGVLLTVPQFREIPAISGLIIRINEKLGYIARGRLDLLTTDRAAIWQEALEIFSKKNVWGKLFGGSVVTVMYIDKSLISIAIHQSIIQGLLNFGILGVLLIYVPVVGILVWRLLNHFMKKPNYEGEDVGILRIMFPIIFLVFGMSVDFFIDWTYMFFYFI